MSAKMNLADVKVRAVKPGADSELDILWLMADFNTLGLEWPNFFRDEKTDKIFKFECNEIMEDWMAGKVGGYARYVEYRLI
jgi:hypothetical protein